MRAPVAIINFAFFVRELLIESYINSERFSQGFDAKLIIATGARATPIIEISPPHKNPPLETPDMYVMFLRGKVLEKVFPKLGPK